MERCKRCSPIPHGATVTEAGNTVLYEKCPACGHLYATSVRASGAGPTTPTRDTP